MPPSTDFEIGFTFKPLEKSDFVLIGKWLTRPHVKKFWDDGEGWKESYERYIHRTSPDVVKQFIVLHELSPIGYIQYYWAARVGGEWWPGIDDETVGIDQYIGEPDYLDKGFGTAMIRDFTQTLFRDKKIRRIIADPSPKNPRAIRCYEKVGFQRTGEVKTPDGPAVLMELLRQPPDAA